MRVWRHAAWLGTPITACAMAAGDPPPSGQRVDPENSPEIAVDGGLGESGSGGGKLEPPLADASWGGSEAPDAACAEIATSDVEPEIFVQLDRSCAMLHGGTSMWAVAVASLTTFSDALTKHAELGLGFFPDLAGSVCKQDDDVLPVKSYGSKQVAALLASEASVPSALECEKSLSGAVGRIASGFGGSNSGPRYGVLIMRGDQQGCGAENVVSKTVNALEDLVKNGIRTFVVSLGGNDEYLQDFAIAGGKARPESKVYFRATSQSKLDEALDEIARITTRCSLVLDGEPSEPSALSVFLNDATLPRDPAQLEGWDYAPAARRIDFYGYACQMFAKDKIQDVRVVDGCDAKAP